MTAQRSSRLAVSVGGDGAGSVELDTSDRLRDGRCGSSTVITAINTATTSAPTPYSITATRTGQSGLWAGQRDLGMQRERVYRPHIKWL